MWHLSRPLSSQQQQQHDSALANIIATERVAMADAQRFLWGTAAGPGAAAREMRALLRYLERRQRCDYDFDATPAPSSAAGGALPGDAERAASARGRPALLRELRALRRDAEIVAASRTEAAGIGAAALTMAADLCRQAQAVLHGNAVLSQMLHREMRHNER